MIEEIRQFISEELLQFDAKSKHSDDQNLFELGLDSLNIMRLIVFIEETFNVQIPEDKVSIENLSTINKIKDLMKTIVSENSN